MKFRIAIDTALDTVQKNLDAHLQEFKDASDVWIADVTVALERLRDAVSKQGVRASQVELQKLFYSVPQDNRSQYATYIGALKLAKANGATDIELDEDDYDRVFNDNWQWRAASKALNETYSSRKGG